MKEQKIKTTQTVNNYIDTETGEILETDIEQKHETIIINTKEKFAMTYSSIISAIKGLNPSDKSLLIYISLKAGVNSNLITLVKPTLEEIAKESDISISTIKRSISNLVKKDILIRKGSGLYRVNPKYYWRGDSITRNKTMKYVLEIECKN